MPILTFNCDWVFLQNQTDNSKVCPRILCHNQIIKIPVPIDTVWKRDTGKTWKHWKSVPWPGYIHATCFCYQLPISLLMCLITAIKILLNRIVPPLRSREEDKRKGQWRIRGSFQNFEEKYGCMLRKMWQKYGISMFVCHTRVCQSQTSFTVIPYTDLRPGKNIKKGHFLKTMILKEHIKKDIFEKLLF